MSSRIAMMVLRKLHAECRTPNGADLPFYSKFLQLCFSDHPATYDTEQFSKEYKRFAINPSLFASLLVTDADLEGYSAAQLWTYSSRIEHEGFAAGMQQHARDEARHSRMFSNLL